MRPTIPLPVAIATAATLSLFAVACVTGAWWTVTGTQELGPLLAVIAVTIAGMGAIWLLDAILFRPGRERLATYLIGLAVTLAGLGALVWLGAAEVTSLAATRGGVFALCLARPFLGAVQASRRSRSAWWQLLAGVGVWNVWLAVYMLVGHSLGRRMPGWDGLVWGAADQVNVLRIARNLLDGELPASSFLMGLPLLVALLTLVVDRAGLDAVEATNLVNTFLAPIHAGIVMPLFVWGLARVACRAAGMRPTWTRILLGMAFVAGMLVSYTLLVPEYVLDRNSVLVPRRLLGLVFGPEPVGFVALAGALLVLTGRNWRWHPVAVGGATGLVVLIHERFVPAAALFLGLLVVTSAPRWRALLAALVALVTFAPQLLYFRIVYGGWLFPNRAAAWERGERAEHWLPYVRQRYDLPPDVTPTRMSLDYVAVNAVDMLKFYGVALALTAAAAALLAWRHPQRWPLWAFCCGHIVVTFVMSAMYVNATVTWRYNALALPTVAVLVLAAVWTLYRPDAARPAATGRPSQRRPAGHRRRPTCEAACHGS